MQNQSINRRQDTYGYMQPFGDPQNWIHSPQSDGSDEIARQRQFTRYHPNNPDRKEYVEGTRKRES